MLYLGLTDTDPTAYRGPARRRADRAQRHPARPRAPRWNPSRQARSRPPQWQRL